MEASDSAWPDTRRGTYRPPGITTDGQRAGTPARRVAGWRAVILWSYGLTAFGGHAAANAGATLAQQPTEIRREISGEAQAQAQAASESEWRRQQERTEEQQQLLEPRPAIESTTPPSPTERLSATETPCFTIRTVAFRTEDPADATPRFDWLAESLSGPDHDDSPINRCLGPAGIGIVLQRARAELVARGLVTTRVLAQTQNLRDGVLLLSVIPGRVNAIRLKNDARVSLHNAIPIAPGDILNASAIEQALENLTRPPTVAADITIDAADGRGPNQSDLLIQHTQTRPARFTATVDDSGSRGTGRLQGSATLSLDNPMGWSDLFYFTLNHDLNAELGRELGNTLPGDRGTRSHTVHYAVPLGYWSLAGTHTSGRFHYQVFGRNLSYSYRGTNESNDLTLTRVLQRNPHRTTGMSLKVWQRESHNFNLDTEVMNQRRSVGGFELGLNHKTTLHTTRIDAQAHYRHGARNFDTLPLHAIFFHDGRTAFNLFSLNLQASTPFQMQRHNGQHSVHLRVQQNGSPLPPQELFSIGTRHAVRGFDGESSLSGEQGWTLHNEVSTALGSAQHTFFAGLDTGEVGGPSSQQLLGSRLTGIVFGLRGALNRLRYDVYIGAPLDQPKHFKTAHTAAGFTLTLCL